MSTELKFRAWDNIKMRYFDFSDIDGGNIGVPSWDDCLYLYSENVILMQFTGLLDKNGKEIYEGDIVKIISKSTFKLYGDTEKPLEVKWDGCCYSVRNIIGDASLYHYCNKSEYDSEIVGNIYEGLHSGEKTDILNT